MAPSKTVIEHKTAFLNAQVRILAQPFELPSDFKEQTSIPNKTVDSAMAKVNREYSTHIKAALYPIALRSVAEQIDALYWESGAPTQHTPYDDVIRKTDDLTDDRIISSLNEDMMTSDDVREKIARLKQLAERRTAVQAKLQKYRALQAELEFLKDPAISIQPHLGTRDGPLVQELTASRGLSTKLAGRIAGQKRPNTEALTSSRRSTEFLLSDQDRVKSVLLDSSMQDS